MEDLKVAFSFNTGLKDDTDSDASFSEDSSVNVELENLYALPKVNTIDSSESSNSKKKRNDKERLPTRRPDPNVYNRNALLARENRRKKKAHLETLEKALHESKRVNTALLDALKRQFKVTRRLEREKMYYKNIVSNRTEIMNLVSALNGRLRDACGNTPRSHLSRTSPPQDSLYSYSGSSSSNYEPEDTPFAFDYSDNGRVVTGIEQSNNLADFNENCFFDPFLTELEPHTSFEETWNELLHDKNFFGLNCCSEGDDEQNKTAKAASDIENEILENISKEHSYVTPTNEEQPPLEDVTGVCLHIAGGKVSLEFCPTCHFSANQIPPMQLLQEDAVA